ncbi:MAG TPA: prepilin-type N-terminal cleavage/methylation domain-containing protein [Myxococcota bacterium]|nr:prepilin-type N-terminal cleavage/methylation domain-containing protein [Myxococcota bacterium]
MSPDRTTARLCTGFTLIELMITAAIIGALAAIAIPNFLRYQLRARATETLTHMKGISTSEDAYYADHGTYVSVNPAVPASLPGTQRVQWPTGTRFDQIGWAPEGGVVFQYSVRADDPRGTGSLSRFTVETTSDLDNDTVQAYFALIRPLAGFGGLAGALPGTTCVAAGVYGPGGQNVLDAPGPCDSQSGRNRF